MLVVERDGSTMFARIGGAGVESPRRAHVNPARKEHHWGRRKLALDR
jgi:hypothetical protein